MRAAGRAPLNLEELLSKLEKRYEGREKPANIGILIFENQDLKSEIKAFQRRSQEEYGETAAKVLKRRGVLHSSKGAGDVTDDDIKDMIEVLAEKYATRDQKPTTMDELRTDNPEYNDVITAFSSRCKRIFGIKPKQKLIEAGIYTASRSFVPDVEERAIQAAIDTLGELLCDLPARCV